MRRLTVILGGVAASCHSAPSVPPDAATCISATAATGETPIALATADLAHDGRLDVITGDYNGGGLSIVPGNGDGSFQPFADYAVDGAASSLVVGDFNGDGDLDLVFTLPKYSPQGPPDSLGVLLGNGDRTFRRESMQPIAAPTALAAADFDHDGKLDLAVLSRWQVHILLGDGSGAFRDVGAYSQGGSFALADLDGDGNLDLVVGNGGSGQLCVFNCGSDYVEPTPGWIAVLLGSGDGTFGMETQVANQIDTASVRVADLNLDGVPDIVASDVLGSAIVILGAGSGTFSKASSFGSPGAAVLAVADVDGDGKPDV